MSYIAATLDMQKQHIYALHIRLAYACMFTRLDLQAWVYVICPCVHTGVRACVRTRDHTCADT